MFDLPMAASDNVASDDDKEASSQTTTATEKVRELLKCQNEEIAFTTLKSLASLMASSPSQPKQE